MQEPVFIEHNKSEDPQSHTTEHILNQTMVRLFGCRRSANAHIERRKSKCDYTLSAAPSEEQVTAIECRVNDIISKQLDVRIEYVTMEEASKIADLSKLPDQNGDVIRIVRIGDYDTCACAGTHVSNTSEIGHFRIISHDYANGRWRVRWKLE
ncbi:MAG: hypothetical protein Q8914_01550 [Bacteroidota bacterium]|nr:hypothetical protein [Bacteroidota bacterium]